MKLPFNSLGYLIENFFSPTTNGGKQNGSSVGIYCIHCTHCIRIRFGTFGTDLYAQSVLINKISALELSRKFNKSALLVGRKFGI